MVFVKICQTSANNEVPQNYSTSGDISFILTTYDLHNRFFIHFFLRCGNQLEIQSSEWYYNGKSWIRFNICRNLRFVMKYIPTAAADFGYHRDQSVVFLLNQLIQPYFTFEFHTNSPIEHYCGNTQKCSVEWKMKVCSHAVFSSGLSNTLSCFSCACCKLGEPFARRPRSLFRFWAWTSPRGTASVRCQG